MPRSVHRHLGIALLAVIQLAGIAAEMQPVRLLGTNVHFAQGKAVMAENLDLIRSSGFNAIREDLTWGGAEMKVGEYRFDDRLVTAAAERGLQCLYILNSGNPLYAQGGFPVEAEAVEAFARFCEAAVRRYQGRVRHYQIWNEWEGGTGMQGRKGRLPDYLRLLKTVYPRLKAIDPGITVVGNAIVGSWCPGTLDELLDGGLLTCTDVVAVNCYAFRREDPTGLGWSRQVEGLQEQCRRRNGGRPFPLMITEFGWTTNGSAFGTAPNDAACFGAQAFLLAAAMPWLHGLFWYDFQDDGWKGVEREDNFGTLRPDLTPKPAFSSLADAVGLVRSARFEERMAMPAAEAPVVALRFRRPDGSGVLAVWSGEREAEYRLTLQRDGAAAGSVRMRLAGRGGLERPWSSRDWVGRSRTAAVDAGRLQITAGAEPLLVEGDLAGLRIVACERVPFPQERPGRVASLRLPGAIAVATPAAEPRRHRLALADWHGAAGFPAGPGDLSAWCELAYTPDALVLTVQVTDDIQHQGRPLGEAWNGDSLQFALRDPAGTDGGFVQFDCAEVAGRPQAMRRGAPDRIYDPAGPVTAALVVQGSTRTWTITVPAAEVPLTRWGPGALLALSLLVNDSDGSGRKGYLGWGGGIGGSKDPAALNWVVLAP